MATLPGQETVRMSSTTPSKSGPASFVTPTKRAALGAGAEAGPSRIRPQAASPAYSSRKHSLYGVEDRVVIDPGSRIWKVGFSGEIEPRAAFWAGGDEQEEAWDLDLQRIKGARGDREEGRRVVEANILRKSRETFIKHLMTDSKTRKVIVLESTFLPVHVKEAIAQALFDNLRVPSIAFTPSSLLALAACGRITGLVIDCGWLETTVTPVSHSRPLVHLARSTPIAGRTLHRRLRALLHHHAVYVPPTDQTRRLKPVPLEVLTDRVVEQVLTTVCTVADSSTRLPSATTDASPEAMDVDPPNEPFDEIDNPGLVQSLHERYSQSSTRPAKALRIPHSASPREEHGTLVVPGWILDRAAEVLLEDDPAGEEESVPRAILATLLKLPVDLRATMISALLVVGGTASLPNFVPRLRSCLAQSLSPASTAVLSPADTISLAAWKNRHTEPYRELYPLASKLAILNDPRPLESAGGGSSKGGTAPRWTPGLMSWVGGSLAGALKTGGPELMREEYDTLQAESAVRGDQYRQNLDDAESEAQVAAAVGLSLEELRPGMALLGSGRKRGWRDGVTLGDWTRPGQLKV